MSQSAADRHGSGGLAFEEYGETGFNYRMTDLQAAIGLVQLTRLGEIVSRRRELAEGLSGPSGDGSWPDLRRRSGVGDDELPVLLDPARQRVRGRPQRRHGRAWPASVSPVGAASWPPIWSRPVSASSRGRLPVTERITSTTLILPLFHEMTIRRRRPRRATAIRDWPTVTAVRRLVLVGAGGFARETTELVRALNVSIPPSTSSGTSTTTRRWPDRFVPACPSSAPSSGSTITPTSR